MAAVAAMVDGNLQLCTATDALRANNVHGPARKRQIDEDFKQASVHVTLQKRRATTAGQWLKADAACHRKLGDRWNEADLCSYQAACWMTFAKSQTLTVCVDGSRLGNPAEETINYVLWSPGNDYACWLPGQVY